MILPPRPKEQDIRPKSFRLPPTLMILMRPASERYILWIIAHYPYVFNPYFLQDIVTKDKKQTARDSELGKALEVLSTLIDKHYVKQSKDLMKYHITRKGQWYRLTTHSQWPLIQVGLPATVGIIGICLTIYFNTRKNNKATIPTPAATEAKRPISDSAAESAHPSLDQDNEKPTK